MLDPKFFDNLAKQLSALVPADLKAIRADLEKNFRSTLVSIFSRLDLVTREEFDVQARLLEKARERINELENKIQALEDKLI